MKRKWFSVGIVLLFIGIATVPQIHGTSSSTRNTVPIDSEQSTFQVVITLPENGIYCNNHKILPFPFPLFICGPIFGEIMAVNTSGMVRAEFYFNGALQSIVTGPGPTYTWNYTIGQFSKFNIKVAASSGDEYVCDEVTIWNYFSKSVIITMKWGR